MLQELRGSISRLAEILIYKEEAKIELCCHETLMRCWFMVCDVLDGPHQGLRPHPCWCRPPSGRRRFLPMRPIQEPAISSPSPNPASPLRLSHVALPPLAEFRTVVLEHRDPLSPYFQETVQECLPETCFEMFQLLVVWRALLMPGWPSFHLAWTHLRRRGFSITRPSIAVKMTPHKLVLCASCLC